jgi:uncharacterized protein YodC (DUF2158 family)
MKDKFQVGDLVESKSGGVMWIVTKTELSASSPQGYCVTLQRSTWMKQGRGGSRTDYPTYYALVCRPHSSKTAGSEL